MAIKNLAQTFKKEIKLYALVIKDKRTPHLAKILLGSAISYLFMPFDLIPDFIPVLGQLDDLIIVPLLIFIALKLIPTEVVNDCRIMAAGKK